MQVAAADPNARYALGSVLNHVLLHQTIIGEGLGCNLVV
jgi:tryptophan synthase beta chain